ncbi:DUF87 domain-containing protein [Candidatus Woesearchaeota archaeon]|nr:DUF87 domain-containing protein [Candidatus Woesearchaeota archaeon]
MYEIIIGRTESERKLGLEGTIFIGKMYVRMGQTTSLSNKVFLDVINPHIILISGKRGCLSGETKIFTNHGYKDIKDFDESKDKIWSFNKEKRTFEWENAKLLKYPINNEKLVKIEFKDGKSLIATKEHPLLLEYGKYIFWRNANEINEKDKIISANYVPEVKNDKESEKIARLLGFVLADGTMNIRKGRFKDGRGCYYNGNKGRLRIFNACDEVLKIAKDDLEKEFNINVKRYKRNDCNCEVVETKHQKVIKKFNELGIPLGKKAGIIRVPNIVFESSNKFKSNFISALFCCDGYVPLNGNSLDYSSKSKEFLLDLQLLLHHFSIESVIRKKMAKCNGKLFENYRLFITDNHSIKTFQKEIPLFSKYKQNRIINHKFGPVERRKKTMYISNELVCSKIKNISEIEGISEVFDLNVPKNHSFVANGIISHNSGKSHSLGVIAEEISNLPENIAQNISVLILDTMGIFWTMKFPNDREEDLLNMWNLKPTATLKANIFIPKGYFNYYKEQKFPCDYSFSIAPSELSALDWCSVFNLEVLDPIGILTDNVIDRLQEAKGKNYDIKDIIIEIKKETKIEEKVKNGLENLFMTADSWGLFDKNATPIKDIIDRGKISIIDTSIYKDWNVKCLVSSIIAKKLLLERMVARKLEELKEIEKGYSYFFSEELSKKEQMPLVWILVDEMHEMLPKNKITPATDAFVQLLREGRQPGISLVMATQQPGEIHRDAITQSDIVISHRITAKNDIDALKEIMQTYLSADILKYLNELPKLAGSAIILDDNSERIYPIRIRPRFSWHGGESPKALHIKREQLIELGL